MALTKIDDRGLKTPIDLLDNEKIRLGTGNDLELYHDGSNSYIKDTGTGNLQIVSNQTNIQDADLSHYQAKFIDGGAVELYHSGTKKFDTTSYGTRTTGNHTITGQLTLETDGQKAVFGAGNDLEIYHDGSNSYINNDTNYLQIQSSYGVLLQRHDGSENLLRALSNGAVELYYDGNEKLKTTSTGVSVTGGLTASGSSEFTEDVKFDGSTTGRDILFDRSENKLHFADNAKAVFGESSDLQLLHDGSHSYLNNDTGALVVRNNTGTYNGESIKIQALSGEDSIVCNPNAAVELYHDNSLRYFTRSNGGTVQGATSNVSLDFRTDTTHRGSVYASSGNSIGFLDTGGDWAVKHTNDTSTEFYVQTNKKATIDADGLKFGTDTAAANALDDYEEGTWTPVLDGSTYGGNSQGYTARVGNYTKIGNLVTVSCYLTWNNFNGTGHLQIAGLPFSALNSNTLQHAGPVMLDNMTWPSGSSHITTHNWYGISYFRLYGSSSGGTWSAVQCDGAAGIICTMTYFSA